MSKQDRQPRQLSLDEKLQIMSFRIACGKTHPNKPLYEILMDPDWPEVYESNLKGFDPLEIPEQPESAGEAAVRQKVLTEWLKEGWTYSDFCNRFGGPSSVAQTETQIYP